MTFYGENVIGKKYMPIKTIYIIICGRIVPNRVLNVYTSSPFNF
jgi:hypothetical protein